VQRVKYPQLGFSEFNKDFEFILVYVICGDGCHHILKIQKYLGNVEEKMSLKYSYFNICFQQYAYKGLPLWKNGQAAAVA
jgi:hypothetical protein